MLISKGILVKAGLDVWRFPADAAAPASFVVIGVIIVKKLFILFILV